LRSILLHTCWSLDWIRRRRKKEVGWTDTNNKATVGATRTAVASRGDRFKASTTAEGIDQVHQRKSQSTKRELKQEFRAKTTNTKLRDDRSH
jgi:hypothetical protein